MFLPAKKTNIFLIELEWLEWLELLLNNTLHYIKLKSIQIFQVCFGCESYSVVLDIGSSNLTDDEESEAPHTYTIELVKFICFSCSCYS